MHRVIGGLGCIALATASAVQAAKAMGVDELRAQNAQLLSKAELDQLIPGSVSHSETERATRQWKHSADGSLAGSGQFKPGQGDTRGGSGRGTWRITESGDYCVEIEWSRTSEKWCRQVYRLGADYYAVAKRADGPSIRFRLSK